LQQHVDDLRNHIPGALHGDRIANAQILAAADRATISANTANVVSIVQRHVGNGDAANEHGLEAADRRQRAGAADLDIDAIERRLLLFCGDRVRDRRAWTARNETEPLLQRQRIHLVNGAIDFVGELLAAGEDVVIDREQLFGVLGALDAGERKAKLGQTLDAIELRLGQRLTQFTPAVHKETQRARRGDFRIELAKCAGGAVARVDVGLLAVLLERGVHFRERRLLHVDFTTHFEHGGRAFDRVWDVRDGAEVRSDVLALTAVAARGALHELAILVAERGRETVDLWLC